MLARLIAILGILALIPAGTAYMTEETSKPAPGGNPESCPWYDPWCESSPIGSDPAGSGTSCGPVHDGSRCTFRCIGGRGVNVVGHNNNGYWDYDGYADCGGTSVHCRAANGEQGCSASGTARFTSGSGSCYAYNDWGPTESTTCWGS